MEYDGPKQALNNHFTLSSMQNCAVLHSARNKDQKLVGHFLKMGYVQLTDCCPIKNVQEIWPTGMNFGWPNWKIVECYFKHCVFMHRKCVVGNLICDPILEKKPSCHIQYFEKY